MTMTTEQESSRLKRVLTVVGATRTRKIVATLVVALASLLGAKALDLPMADALVAVAIELALAIAG